MKHGLRLLLPVIGLVVILLSVDGATRPRSVSADWPGDCVQWGTTTTWEWQFVGGYWQIMPVQQQACVQWGYVQPWYNQYYYSTTPFIYGGCSAFYFSWNQCGLPMNYNGCSQAFVDQWGNRFTCFGVEYGVWDSGGVIAPSWPWR
jgi:hypothetical protein